MLIIEHQNLVMLRVIIYIIIKNHENLKLLHLTKCFSYL